VSPLRDVADQVYLSAVMALAALYDGDLAAVERHIRDARDMAYACTPEDGTELYTVEDFMPEPTWLDLRDPPC
jgi:hypothetical protein